MFVLYFCGICDLPVGAQVVEAFGNLRARAACPWSLMGRVVCRSGTPHWEKRSDGYEVAFSAKNFWFDKDEDPGTTAERYARVWTSTFPATSFDPDYDSFAYGAQLAGLVDSDQLRVTGGFDGDNWIYLVEVSCDTPGFRAPAPGVSIEPFAHP